MEPVYRPRFFSLVLSCLSPLYYSNRQGRGRDGDGRQCESYKVAAAVAVVVVMAATAAEAVVPLLLNGAVVLLLLELSLLEGILVTDAAPRGR